MDHGKISYEYLVYESVDDSSLSYAISRGLISTISVRNIFHCFKGNSIIENCMYGNALETSIYEMHHSPRY